MNARIAVLSMLALAAASARGVAQAGSDGGARRMSGGIKAGMVAPGAFYWSEGPYASYDLSLSLNAGVFVDWKVGSRVSLGVYSDMIAMNAFSESALMFDGGLALKAQMGDGSKRVTWRPELGVGLGELGSIYYFTGTNYLTLRGGTEVLLHSGGKHTWLGEILVYGAPTGGNVDVTTSFGPVALVRIGMVF